MSYIKNLLILSLFTFTLRSAFSQQWVIEANFFPWYLNYISVIDTGVVWVASSHDVIRKTPGSVWYMIPVPLSPEEYITCVDAVDSMRAWVGTQQGKIFRTTNAGTNWILQIDVGGSSYINDIKFSRVNRNYAYIFADPPNGLGTPFKIYKTTNAGLNWIEYSPMLGSNYGLDKSACVTDSEHAWFGLFTAYYPQIAYTTNGGLNWAIRTLPGYDIYTRVIGFRYDNQFGMVAAFGTAGYGYIYRTTNSGVSWSPVSSLSYHFLERGVWVPETSVWYYARDDSIGKSSDNGDSWFTMYSAENDALFGIDAVKQDSRIYAWAITYNGLILKCLDTAVTIGITPLSGKVPSAFKLGQNYPNPFNPTTTISFDIPKHSFIRLFVYDVLGRQVALLIEQDMNPGSYEVKFDGKNYSSGVYFYKLTADEFSETKKMVIIK